MTKSISIIGGGLAGLALGIGLRQRGIPVTLFEAGSYPRHRVCGEYLSGDGCAVLDRLNLSSLLESKGAAILRTVQFISTRHQSPIRTSPTAYGLSRHKLDESLAAEFTRLGGELKLKHRSTAPVEAGFVRASGRRPHSTENGWRWFGLKAHARGINLEADLELHITRDSYVGISRIEGDQYNVCGLFRSSGRPTSHQPLNENETATPAYQRLRGRAGSLLNERLANAEFNPDSFCAVAGLSLQSRLSFDSAEVAIGDALTMIPPATGNGMSMALESAELAIDPLARFSRSDISWDEARIEIQRRCRAAFASRLLWARLLQTLMFSGIAHNGVGGFLMRSDLFWNWMFTKTRA